MKNTAIRVRGWVKENLLLILLSAALAVLLLLNPQLLYRLPAYASIPTIAAITCFLIASRILELSGAFTYSVDRLLEHTGGSPRRALASLILATSIAAALMMNDAAMFFAVPLAVALSRVAGIDKPEAVAAVALAANIGSSLTPIGNPQNIYIWTTWKTGFWSFTAAMAPYVAVWLIILLVYIGYTTPSTMLKVGAPPPVQVSRNKTLIGLVLLVADVVLIENGLWPVALLTALVAALLAGREVLAGIDYSLIATLALMFIVFNEIAERAPLPSRLPGLELILLGAALSQVISNVPATIVLAKCAETWVPLAIGVNLGGLGTVIGSLANLIGVRLSGVSLKKFHRHTIPVFALSAVASLLLYLVFTLA